MTKDFKDMRKWTESDEEGLENFMGSCLAIFFIFCAAAIIYSACSVSDANAENKPEKTYQLIALPINKNDKTMKSPQALSYSKKVSHKKITDLGDVE